LHEAASENEGWAYRGIEILASVVIQAFNWCMEKRAWRRLGGEVKVYGAPSCCEWLHPHLVLIQRKSVCVPAANKHVDTCSAHAPSTGVHPTNASVVSTEEFRNRSLRFVSSFLSEFLWQTAWSRVLVQKWLF
jgi:hypothetical protein